jgi:hypothetical protein
MLIALGFIATIKYLYHLNQKENCEIDINRGDNWCYFQVTFASNQGSIIRTVNHYRKLEIFIMQ